jgi:hypothetical protein
VLFGQQAERRYQHPAGSEQRQCFPQRILSFETDRREQRASDRHPYRAGRKDERQAGAPARPGKELPERHEHVGDEKECH